MNSVLGKYFDDIEGRLLESPAVVLHGVLSAFCSSSCENAMQICIMVGKVQLNLASCPKADTPAAQRYPLALQTTQVSPIM